MLPSENRLKARVDFANVKKHGKVVAGKNFSLAYLTRGEGPARIGFVVSTKISKRAVDRNRIKRSLRAEVRKRIDLIKEGYDLVFLVRPAVLTAEAGDLAAEVDKLVEEAGLKK